MVSGGDVCRKSPQATSSCEEAFFLLGGAGVGNITYKFGETLGDEPGGGRICGAESRGDHARAQLPTHPVSYLLS
jgi:hypothetical protein